MMILDIQEAIGDDIEQLAIHHRKMFEEMWEKKGKKLEAVEANDIENAYLGKLEKEIPTGSCKSWVVKNGNQIIASGAISIVSYAPVPKDTNQNIAFLHSMYTEKKFRGKKYAQQLIEKAIQYCKENGINRVFLNSSDTGKPVYEKFGFLSSTDTMKLFIRGNDDR